VTRGFRALLAAAVLLVAGCVDVNAPLSGDEYEREAEELEKEVEGMGQELISDILEEVLEASNKMKYSPIPQLPLELAVVEICEN